MAVTILECLQNAHHNLSSPMGFGPIKSLGLNQLENAITLLEKGYDIGTEVDPLIAEYGDAKAVPDASLPKGPKGNL